MKKLAFLFPGQGSQSVGMLDDFSNHPDFTDLVSILHRQADATLGESLSSLIAQGPADALNATVNTQPAMLLSDVVCFQAWLQAGGARPEVVAGHSLGEYAALVAAGVFSLEQAVSTVRIRAQAMQTAVPAGLGGMAAVLGLPDEAVIAVCKQASEGPDLVEAVNFNAPSQVVIAGTATAVARACEIAKASGAKRALPLPVSAPFHSSLMLPAAQVLERHLESVELSAPRVACINNVDVMDVTSITGIKQALVRQAHSPVRWVETIQALDARGVTHYVECGPGKVLSGLVKRISDKPVFNIFDSQSLKNTLEQLA
ncbi:MAG: ACP S-malonyltransferase [Burkholderiales bacterium]|nr:ACP S-malonyltransferase [Burkholderiales bacterium]